MTTLDWVALGFALFTGLVGYRRGLVGTALSLAGLLAGAVLGARIAPHLVQHGNASAYASLIALGGAVAGAVLGKAVAGLVGSFVRGGLRLVPPLNTVDSLGGLAVGAVWGLALVWVAAAVAMELPKSSHVRESVRQSQVVQQLDKLAPPSDVLRLKGELHTLPPLPGF